MGVKERNNTTGITWNKTAGCAHFTYKQVEVSKTQTLKISQQFIHVQEQRPRRFFLST